MYQFMAEMELGKHIAKFRNGGCEIEQRSHLAVGLERFRNRGCEPLEVSQQGLRNQPEASTAAATFPTFRNEDCEVD